MLREGRLDFPDRAAQHQSLLRAVLDRDTPAALGGLERLITSEIQA
jgi:GntR family carbon starvation induced transcriptional regulator